MTVSSEQNRIRYSGNDTTTVFPVPFMFLLNADIKAYRISAAGVPTLLTLNSDYTLTGAGDDELGGELTMTTAPATGTELLILRDPALTQPMDLVVGSAYPPTTIEKSADRTVLELQRLADRADFAIRMPDTAAAGDFALPGGVDRAGTFLGFDASGKPTFLSGTGADSALRTDLASTDAGKGAALVAGVWRVINAADEGLSSGASTAAQTAALQAAVARMTQYSTLVIPHGDFTINDELVIPVSNCAVVMQAGTRISQVGTDKNIFKADSLDNVWIHCNGGILYGEGTWSAGWTGNSGHEDRAIQFIACTRSGITFPTIKNCGSAGISIIGGSNIRIVCPHIEGTNAYSTVVTSNGNFQHGIYLKHDSVEGDLDDVVVVSPDISGTAQGILIEGYASFASDAKGIVISCPNIHDIPGQHGMYIQTGKVTVSSPVIDNCALNGIKIQSGTSNYDIKGFTVEGFNISNCGSAAFELQTDGSGAVSGVHATGVSTNCQRGLSVNKNIRDCQIDIVVNDCTQHGVILQGAGLADIGIRAKIKRAGIYGILAQATGGDNINIWPTIREPNTTENANGEGINIQGGANITLYDPDITDADTNMLNGLRVQSSAGDVRVRGSIRSTGASAYGVRADKDFVEYPTEATVSGGTAAYISIGTQVSTQPVITPVIRTTSTSAASLWQRTLADESVYRVTAEITGKLAGSAQRASYIISGTFYRDGGSATQEGSTTTVSSQVSGSFTGVVAFDVSGNAVRIRVHSGATADYDWKARVTVTPLFD